MLSATATSTGFANVCFLTHLKNTGHLSLLVSISDFFPRHKKPELDCVVARFIIIYKLDSLFTAVCEYASYEYVGDRSGFGHHKFCLWKVVLSASQYSRAGVVSITAPPPNIKKIIGKWGGLTLWLKQGKCVRIERQPATKFTKAHRESYCTDFDINPWA